MTGRSNHPIHEAPLVVKIGGSLCACVMDLVPVFRNAGRPLLIVPGGGIFADVVRRMGVDNDSAHWMAVAAMDQYGWYIGAQGIPVTAHVEVPATGPVVFLPYCSMRERNPLPHSWDVTSDSIAAWVADCLGLDLLVLKSVDGIRVSGDLVSDVHEPVRTDVVDPFFIPYVLKRNLRATIINGSRSDLVAKCLKGKTVPGTRIGITF